MARLSSSEARTQWGAPSEKLGNVDLTSVHNAQGRSAYDRLSELAGQGLRPALQAVMNRPSYQGGSDGDSFAVGSRATMLQETILRYLQNALQQTMREYPELRTKAQADQRYKTATKHGQQSALTGITNLQ